MTKDRRTWWATGAPSVLGAGFPILVKLDQMMFQAGWISGRAAIGVEFVYLLAFMASVAVAIALCIRFVRDGSSISVPGVVLGLIIGAALVFVGLSNGAAVLHAT